MKNYLYPLLIGLALAGQQVMADADNAPDTAATAAARAWVQAMTPATPAATPAYTWQSPKLDRARLDALLAEPEKLLLIDVRRPDELSKIGGFGAYLSIQAKDIEKYLAFIPRDRTLVTVSNHAGRAGAAADLLVAKGFKVAGAVGAQNYEEEGGTLLKVTPPPAPVPP
jgi:rhodanese-related sulfurtransferase